jgi:hypothetical protein
MVARPAFPKLFAELYRDYNTTGVPSSGAFPPIKSDIRTRGAFDEGLWNQTYDKLTHLLGTLGGSANAATAQATPTLDARVAGQSYWYMPAATNTAAAPTLNIDGTGAATLADADGADLPIGGVIGGRAYVLLDDGTKYRVVGRRDEPLYKVLDADDTAGSNSTTAQPWFPTAGGLTLPVGKWFLEGFLWLSRSTGASSHGTSLLFAGTATYTIDWLATVNIGDVAAIATSTMVAGSSAAATAIKAASTSTTEQLLMALRGRLDVTVGGTFIPQFQYTTAAPGGAPTVKRGSYLRLFPRPGALASVGAWA